MQQFIKYFNEITELNAPETGTKAVRLSTFYQANNAPHSTDGFVVTAAAFRYFIRYNNSAEKLQTIVQNTNPDDRNSLDEAAAQCHKLITNGKMPPALETEIITTYHNYFSELQDVAVRGSVLLNFPAATETYLNIRGAIPLSYAIKCCFASVFTAENLYYALCNDWPVSETGTAVIIQKMVRSDVGASGTVQVIGNTVILKSLFGLGELLPTDEAEPDIFTFDYSNGSITFLSKTQGKKSRMCVYSDHAAGTNSTLLKITPAGLREHFAITDEEALSLTEWVQHGYVHFEWAKDGISNRLYIVNSYNQSEKTETPGKFYHL